MLFNTFPICWPKNTFPISYHYFRPIGSSRRLNVFFTVPSGPNFFNKKAVPLLNRHLLGRFTLSWFKSVQNFQLHPFLFCLTSVKVITYNYLTQISNAHFKHKFEDFCRIDKPEYLYLIFYFIAFPLISVVLAERFTDSYGFLVQYLLLLVNYESFYHLIIY